MARKLIIFFCLFLSFALCRASTVDPFEIVDANGNFIIELQHGDNYRVEIDACQEVTNAVVMHVENGTLYLWRDKKVDSLPGKPAIVRIWSPLLREVNLAGNAKLSSPNLGHDAIVINVSGTSQVYLNGYLDIARIHASGDSLVDIRWVNSDQVQIFAEGNSRIRLAGVTKLLSARLLDCASLDAKYLRTTTALVQTQQQAKAEVLATYSLNAFATDQSDIYFYKTPDKLAEYTTLSGNVLQVDYWE